ncbi:MAG: helix-turn-helix domain-containing protein [Smithellaceae bacterium]|jgi:hypothetical protein
MSRKKTHNKTNIILNRISAHYHLTNDDDIASFYGVSKSTVSSWRTRDSINETLIKAKCSDDNLANWFINGIKTQNQKSGIGEDAGDYNAGQQSPQAHAGTESEWPLKSLIDEIRAQISEQRDKNKFFAEGLLSNDKANKDMWSVINRMSASIERLENKCDQIFTILLEVGKDGDITHLKKIGGDGK